MQQRGNGPKFRRPTAAIEEAVDQVGAAYRADALLEQQIGLYIRREGEVRPADRQIDPGAEANGSACRDEMDRDSGMGGVE